MSIPTQGVFDPRTHDCHPCPRAIPKPENGQARQRKSLIQPFPTLSLALSLRDFVNAASAAIGCDPSWIALPALACVARAIGNSRIIRLKRGWTEPAIIWGALIGKSGTHKTPAQSAALKVLSRKQSQAMEEFQQAVLRHEQDIALFERDYLAWKRSKSSEPPPSPPSDPVCQRYITNDTTIEALVQLLSMQQDGLLVASDELAGWLNSFAQYKSGKGSDLGHWLSTWSAGPLTFDRKTGPVKFMHIPRAAVSVIGGIQPGILRAAINREHMQDGLCARLLLTMPEHKPITWSDAIVAPETETAFEETIDTLLSLQLGEDGKPIELPLTPNAKAVWVDYYNDHRAELYELDDDLAACWTKLEAYSARFALIHQLCSRVGDEAEVTHIDQQSMEAGITLSNWFGDEAKRVYSMLARSDEDEAQQVLLDWIKKRGGRVTAREVQTGLRAYRDSGTAEAALMSLQQKGLARSDVIDTPGRPMRVFTLTTAPTEVNKTREIRTSVGATNGKTSSRSSCGDPVEAFNRQLQEAADDGWGKV